MPFQNYYTGTTLDSIGQAMQQDRDTGARSEIARMEQQRLAYAAFMQQLQQREAQAKQAQQFQQELAFRGQGQNQENAYRNAMLGLAQKRQEFDQNGSTPEEVWLQQFREKELGSRERIAQLSQNQLGQQALAAMINQQGLTGRDMAVADETWQAEAVASKSKSADYQALGDQIESQAKTLETKRPGWRGWGWDDPESRKLEADKFRSQKYSELINTLQNVDRRPGNISPVRQPNGSFKFVEVLRPRPQGQPQSGYNPAGMNPLMFGPPQTNTVQGLDPRQAALIQALQGTQSTTNQNAPPSTAVSQPIRVRASDGRVWIITSQQQLDAVRSRDPGAVILQ